MSCSDPINRGSSSRLSPYARPFTVNQSSISNHPQYPPPRIDDHRCEDKDSAFFIPYRFSSTQGKLPAEGLKPCVLRSGSLYENFIGTSGIDSENSSKTTNQIEWCVPFPDTSELCSTSIHGDTQSGLAYQITCSSSDSNISFYDRYFSQPLDSHAATLKLSCVSEHSSPVQVSGPSGTGAGYLPLNLLLHHSMQSDGYGAFSNTSCNPVIIEDRCTLLNTTNKDTLREILLEKSQDAENGKSKTNEVIDSLTMPQVPYSSVPHELTVKLQGAEEGNSDLDSPCWKGTLAANQSILEDSGPVNGQQLRSGQEELNSLSLLASELFASSDKQNCYRVNECDEDSSSFFHKTASSAVPLQPVEQRSANSVTTGSAFSELTNVIWSCCTNDVCLPDKEDAILKNSNNSSMLKSCILEPSSVEDHCYSNSQLVTGPNIAGTLRGIRESVQHGSSRISFENKNVISSSSCRIHIPSDFTETCQGASRSFSCPPRLHIQKVVNTMNELSELLLHNCSNDLDSLNEHEHDIIEHIINNLTACIRNRNGRRTLMPEATHPCTSYCHRKSADILKIIEKDMAKDHEIKDVNPRVMLYKNLLLETRAARRFIEA
ncbi:uncharacterized protein LOC8288882 isoform X2 [Ricinus communis]|uniref:uncharacterized protein LOC8288882 isoform X2 n=1 Tax=Ricinus communis TaxID=3988 RepID=UPI0007726678|nr:uncharacterized protein LOC8288882 isoform X2 [Ricinus communis]|eukprot:XP_015574493.1 uncharacterized protein LOC8288882 isoform X2 [Ricinus communis]